MFKTMEVENDEYQIKPMNCPFHCLVYKDTPRSYRDLPVRWAELGTVYRYERSGTLHGLFRVRGFTQDDAHIFCLPSQRQQHDAARSPRPAAGSRRHRNTTRNKTTPTTEETEATRFSVSAAGRGFSRRPSSGPASSSEALSPPGRADAGCRATAQPDPWPGGRAR
jgi:hypothetical protein